MPANRRSKRKADVVVQSAAGSLQEPPSLETRDLDETEGIQANKRGKSMKALLSRKKERPAPENLEPNAEMNGIGGEEGFEDAERAVEKSASAKQRKGVAARAPKEKREGDDADGEDACFIGDQVAEDEASERWPHRSSKKKDGDVVLAKCHYLQARVDGCIYILNDDAYVKFTSFAAVASEFRVILD